MPRFANSGQAMSASLMKPSSKVMVTLGIIRCAVLDAVQHLGEVILLYPERRLRPVDAAGTSPTP